jgi:GH18 family chitinase
VCLLVDRAAVAADPARVLQYRSGSIGGKPCAWRPKNLNATLCTHINYSFAFMNPGALAAAGPLARRLCEALAPRQRLPPAAVHLFPA